MYSFISWSIYYHPAFSSDILLILLACLQWNASSACLRIRFPISSLLAQRKKEAAIASPEVNREEKLEESAKLAAAIYADADAIAILSNTFWHFPL